MLQVIPSLFLFFVEFFNIHGPICFSHQSVLNKVHIHICIYEHTYIHIYIYNMEGITSNIKRACTISLL